MATKLWLGGTTGSTNSAAIAANYSPSGVPVAGDNLYVEANPGGTDYSIEAGLDTFAGIALASFNVSQTYTGNIGLTNNGTNSTYLALGGTNSSAITINIGYQYGGTTPASGSNLLRVNSGSMLATYNVTNTSRTSSLQNAGPLTMLGTHSANTLNMTGGIASIAVDPLEVSTFQTVNCGGTLFMGTGVTLTNSTLNNFGGNILVRSNINTITQSGGNLTTAGSGTIATLSVNGGGAILNANGTVTTLNIQTASVDMSGDPRSKTVTTCNIYNGASLNVNNGVRMSIVFTNPLNVQAASGQYSLVVWPNTDVQLS